MLLHMMLTICEHSCSLDRQRGGARGVSQKESWVRKGGSPRSLRPRMQQPSITTMI